ncbi:hypothetical protein MMC07_005437 [Pseudocyphellaria aurata]|nr:hypothetical protein [Pseudocyphellaria aurata]
MAFPSDGGLHAPQFRTNASSIDVPKFPVRPTESSKTAVFPSPTSTSTTGFSVNITRALTVKPKKIRNLRRRRTNEVMATIPQAAVTAPASSRPRHLDLFQAQTTGAVREPRSQPSASNYCIETLKNPGSGSGLERSNAGRQPERQSPGLGSNHVYRHTHMGYNEYLAQSARPSGEGKGKSTGEQHELTTAAPSSSEQSDMSTASMEVCLQMSAKEPLRASGKDRRPKIQLTIPRTHSYSFSAVPHYRGKERTASRSQDTPSTVSPPSTTSRQRTGAELPARLSIVSPLSVVEMPKPRRPFSKFSFEDVSTGMSDSTPLLSKSASSDSSDDTGDHDDRSSNYSARSSVSSLTSDPAVKPIDYTRGSVAFSVMSPAAAGVFDAMPLAPQYPRNPRVMRSTTCLMEKVNRNKPLPPEPGVAAVRPLKFSRTNSMRSRGKAPAPLVVSRQSTINIPRNRDSAVLRSKFTYHADLDALDEKFEKSGPRYLEPPGYTCQTSPTLSQVELALEAHLVTISEDAPLQPDTTFSLSLMHDPLQISRGPMHMEPSRKPPSLPQSHFSSSGNGSLDSRKKLQKKPSTHVALQMRAGRDILRKRTSAPVVGLNNKAHKVLGTTGIPPESDSHWTTSESPRASSSGQNLDDEESDTAESDRSSIAETTFEEVRQRLELLSPKDDASQTFLAFHETIQEEDASSDRDQPVRAQRAVPTPASKPQPSSRVPQRVASPPANPHLADRTLGSKRRAPLIEITPALQSHGQLRERRGRHDDISIRSLGSIAASEIPDIYASLPSPTSLLRQSMTEEEVERMISADAAEQVLLRILENLDNLQDLFNTATVSRGFYRTFKHHELPLMKNALYGMSPAAWELREMSSPYPELEDAGKTSSKASPKPGYTPSLYLQHYMRDMYIMIALKSMILIHCESFLRPDTITALAGGETVRASQIDDAFWRVWTFCRLFGCGTNREDDIVGQMDWLRGGVLARQHRRKTSTVDMGADVDMDSVTFNAPPGFGQGNSGGLSAEDLFDMTEIWTCLGVLVRGFQGKRKEARDFGIFEKSNIAPGDVEKEDAVLEEWTYHLLTLAPPIVLDVTSPTSPTAATFAHARSRGYTTWSPPSKGESRSTFLKEAVSRVYQEKMLQRHPTINIASTPDCSSPIASPLLEEILATRQRIADHGAVIRAKRNDPAFKAQPPSEERPMSNFPDVIARLENPPAVTQHSSSAATLSTLAPSTYLHPSTSSLTTNSPTSVAAPVVPLRSSSLEKHFVSNVHVPLGPQVRDPVDVAVDRLVAMGFDEKKSKKALADTDSGNTIDFEKAVDKLVSERKRDVSNLMNSNYRGAIQPENLSREDQQSPSSAFGLGIGGVPRYS